MIWINYQDEIRKNLETKTIRAVTLRAKNQDNKTKEKKKEHETTTKKIYKQI